MSPATGYFSQWGQHSVKEDTELIKQGLKIKYNLWIYAESSPVLGEGIKSKGFVVKIRF